MQFSGKSAESGFAFFKDPKKYESIDILISKAALSKFSQHLWYLCEEIVILSIFDDEVDEQPKGKMIANLQRERFFESRKRYVPSKEEMSDSLYGR